MADFDVNISDGTSIEVVVTPSSGVGVSDHGELTGLADDDHTLYHTDARGDARYQKESEKNQASGYVGLGASPGTPDGTKFLRDDGTWQAAPSGVTDHGALTGLSDDDHTQYHTDTRGDARYAPLSHVGVGGGAHANAVAAGAAGFLTGIDKAKLDGVENGATADQSATEVAFTAAGGIVATNVQSALQELDSEAEKLANKDQNSGYAGLNSSGRVPIARLASGTPDGTKFIRDDGVLAVPGGGSGYRNLVTLSSDVALSSTSYGDVTGLSFAVSSGTAYRFYFLIIYDMASNASNCPAWAVNGPASPAMLSYAATWWTTGATTATLQMRNTYDANVVSSATPFASGNTAVLEGIVKPSASGTLILRARVSTNGNAVTIKAGSTCEWW